MQKISLQGAGLGLRRDLVNDIVAGHSDTPDFLEVTPENWMQMGGHFARQLDSVAADYPLVAHGLSLSLGGPAPLDLDFIRHLGEFLHRNSICCFSEHLSYCSDQGHLYDLLPIPFTEEAVDYVAQRIVRVQDMLQQRIAVENVSYYAAPYQQLSELEFVNAVVERADCDLLLDVNNVYVNSINHGYDAKHFIDNLPAQRIAYMHIAGHYREDDALIVDTHGAAVIDPVWQLLKHSYGQHGVYPTLLERDFNLPPLQTLMTEVNQVRHYQSLHQSPQRIAS